MKKHILVFFFGISSFTLSAQEMSFVSSDESLRNEMIVRKALIKETGTSHMYKYPNILIVYIVSLKEKYRSLYNEEEYSDNLVIDSLLSAGVELNDMVETTYGMSSFRKKKSRNEETFKPNVFQFIVYNTPSDILCSSNANFLLFFRTYPCDEYLVECVNSFNLEFVFFYFNLCCYYGISKDQKVYKIDTINKTVISFTKS